MEAARTSETSVDNHFTRQYNPEDSSEHHTRRRENLKSHKVTCRCRFSELLTPCGQVCIRPHAAITQNTNINIFTAVGSSNLSH
jgi:hypothetical protein